MTRPDSLKPMRVNDLTSTLPITATAFGTGAVALAAEVRETHTAAVSLRRRPGLQDEEAVDVGFCDFSTLDERAIACQREVDLNRRLSPQANANTWSPKRPWSTATC